MSVMSRRLGRVEAALAEQYGSLSPEERFRLIVAAAARSDEAEQDRLANSGQPIKLTMSDHVPISLAFDELALVMFIEVLETAAGYFELLRLAGDAEAVAAVSVSEVAVGQAEPGGGNCPEAVRL